MQHFDDQFIDAYLENALNPEEAEAARRHLAECPPCGEMLAQRKALLEVLRSFPEEPLPEGFHAGLCRRIESERETARRTAVRRSRLRPILGAVAACLVVGMVGVTLAVGGGFSGIAEGIRKVDAGMIQRESVSEDSFSVTDGFLVSGAAMENGYDTGSYDAAAPETPAEEAMMEEPVAEAEMAGGFLSVRGETLSPKSNTIITDTSRSGQVLVYTASLSFTSQAFDEDYRAILDTCDRLEGFVENVNLSGKPYTEPDGYGRYVYLTLRIPSEHYGEAISGLKAVGVVSSSSEDTRNITYEYNNAQIVVENLRAQRDTLLKLLDAAESLDDVILLQENLSNLSIQIQQAESVVRNMDNEVDYATISVDISEEPEASALLTPKEEKTIGVRMQEGLYLSLAGLRDGFLSFIVGFVAALPFIFAAGVLLGLVGLVVWLILRHIRKRRQHTRI